MSGGHFDYINERIKDIASEIEAMIEINGAEDGDGYNFNFPPVIIDRLREAAHTLRRAHAMAHRIDYLICGDDGEDRFIKRWNEDVAPEWSVVTKQIS